MAQSPMKWKALFRDLDLGSVEECLGLVLLGFLKVLLQRPREAGKDPRQRSLQSPCPLASWEPVRATATLSLPWLQRGWWRRSRPLRGGPRMYKCCGLDEGGLHPSPQGKDKGIDLNLAERGKEGVYLRF